MIFQEWIKDIIEQTIPGSHLKIGHYYIINGHKSKIISGQYMGTHGLSNHWSWCRVLKSGKLSKIIRSGYGGDWKEIL